MTELSAHCFCCGTTCTCAGVRLPHLALESAIPPPQLTSHKPVVAQVASLLLQRQDGRGEQAAAVMRAVAAAAQAAMAVDPETTAVIAEALRKAEAAAAGQLSRHSAVPDQTRQHSSSPTQLQCGGACLAAHSQFAPCAKQRSFHAFEVRFACVCCRRAACRW